MKHRAKDPVQPVADDSAEHAVTSAEDKAARPKPEDAKKLRHVKLTQGLRRHDREYTANEVVHVDGAEADWLIDEENGPIGIEVDEEGRVLDQKAADVELTKTPAQKMIG